LPACWRYLVDVFSGDAREHAVEHIDRTHNATPLALAYALALTSTDISPLSLDCRACDGTRRRARADSI
jgi:hypothetical protein